MSKKIYVGLFNRQIDLSDPDGYWNCIENN